MIRTQLTQAPHVMSGRRFRRQSCADRVYSRSGFTLVEMLVSVTLVLLMMVMFGEIFQLATNSVTKQRVMADNDQNARTFVTIIRGDLEKRSVRNVVPFYANEPVDKAWPPFETRPGYFYISNNSLADGTDDVLQFTADINDVNAQSGDNSPYFGRAIALPGNFLLNSNQPERDDNQITPNGAGASKAAEISIWMRGGKLYRRVMLIREPAVAGEDMQPTDINNNNYFLPTYYLNEDANGNGILDSGEDANGNGVLDGNFWGEFDYSAHREPFLPAASNYAVFNGNEYLSNSSLPLTGAPGLWTASLGQPWNRFGFFTPNPIIPNPPLATWQSYGLPREFSSTTGNPRFVGRFTHQETSDARFQYPQRLSNPGGFNPMDTSNALTLDSDGLVTQFDRGNRVGVDLLLSHVHEFRVEVWDERLNDFAPIGHNLPAGGNANTWGDYNFNRRLNSTYGPLGGQANVFDTWHPQYNRNANVDAGGIPILGDEPDRPPYRPVTIDPTGKSGPSYTNSSGASLFWMPNTDYQVGDVVFPRMEDLNGNGVLDPGESGANGFPSPTSTPAFAGNGLDRRLSEDVNGNGVLDGSEVDGSFGFPADGQINSTNLPFFPYGLAVSYRCVRAGRSGPWSNNEPNGIAPNWQSAGKWSNVRITGRRAPTEDDFGNDNGTLLAWEDFNGNGTDDTLPDEPDWVPDTEISPNGNIRPLKAIRITVRFEHPTSKQMKQVTIVQSLRDAMSVP